MLAPFYRSVSLAESLFEDSKYLKSDLVNQL